MTFFFLKYKRGVDTSREMNIFYTKHIVTF